MTQNFFACLFLNGLSQGIKESKSMLKPIMANTLTSYLTPSKNAEPVIGLPGKL